MMDILLLLFFGKMQDVFAGSETWKLAVGYGVLEGLINLTYGLIPALITGVIAGLVAWGYFLLLRRVQDSLLLWFAAYLLVPLALWGSVIKLIA